MWTQNQLEEQTRNQLERNKEIIAERKAKALSEGVEVLTIAELAEEMEISASRLRTILSEIDAPAPFYPGELQFRCRLSKLYRVDEVVNYFLDTKRQPTRKYVYRKRYIEKGLIDG